ncbi:MAG: hypothetical protein CMC70_05855 [Flavobacteriaceae bacterium]|nr:hypothetical protein [Flavobacteriaceae bacterium]
MARWRVPSNRIFRTASSRDVKRLDYAEPHEWDPERIGKVVGMVSGINKAATGILGKKPLDLITAGISKLAAPGEDKSKPADTREDMLRRAAEARTKRDRAAADLRKMRGAGGAGTGAQPATTPTATPPATTGAGGVRDLSSMSFGEARRYARSTLGDERFKWRGGTYSTVGYEDRNKPRPQREDYESDADWKRALAKARAQRGGTAPEGAQPQPTGPEVTPLTGIRAPAMTPLTREAQPRMPGQMPQLKLREDLQPIPGEPEVRAVPNAAAILQMDSGKGGTMMDAFQGRLDAFVDKGEPQYDLSGQLVQPKYTSADLRPLDPQLIGALLQEGPEGGPAFERLESLYGSEIAEHIQFIAGDFRPILKSVAASMPQYEKAVVEPVASVPTAQLTPPSIVEAVEPADRPAATPEGAPLTGVEAARARERARIDKIIARTDAPETPQVRAQRVSTLGGMLNAGQTVLPRQLPSNQQDLRALAQIVTDRNALIDIVKKARKSARPTKFSDLFTDDHERRATNDILKSFTAGEKMRLSPAQREQLRQGRVRIEQGERKIEQSERRIGMDITRLKDRLRNTDSLILRRKYQNRLSGLQIAKAERKAARRFRRFKVPGSTGPSDLDGYITSSTVAVPTNKVLVPRVKSVTNALFEGVKQPDGSFQPLEGTARESFVRKARTLIDEINAQRSFVKKTGKRWYKKLVKGLGGHDKARQTVRDRLTLLDRYRVQLETAIAKGPLDAKKAKAKESAAKKSEKRRAKLKAFITQYTFDPRKAKLPAQTAWVNSQLRTKLRSEKEFLEQDRTVRRLRDEIAELKKGGSVNDLGLAQSKLFEAKERAKSDYNADKTRITRKLRASYATMAKKYGELKGGN